MAFRGEIEISAPETGALKDEKFSVLDCNYRFYTPSDNYGRITGRRIVGKIHFVIETTPASVQLANVLFTNSAIEGKLTFYNRDSLSKMFEVEFENARIIDLETIFAHTGEMPMMNRVSISAEKITLISSGQMAEDSNDWGVSQEY
ncbi:MAG: hypothetical protein IPP71_09565 [Bacteroidetes bacterium]|nr:hypothetical protein [Bacteroidota bacterium]